MCLIKKIKNVLLGLIIWACKQIKIIIVFYFKTNIRVRSRILDMRI